MMCDDFGGEGGHDLAAKGNRTTVCMQESNEDGHVTLFGHFGVPGGGGKEMPRGRAVF